MVNENLISIIDSLAEDALEILNEIEQILQMNQSSDETLAIIYEYIQQKRTEFQPACGECGT